MSKAEEFERENNKFILTLSCYSFNTKHGYKRKKK